MEKDTTKEIKVTEHDLIEEIRIKLLTRILRNIEFDMKDAYSCVSIFNMIKD